MAIGTGRYWNRKKNGEVYPELLTISAVYDDEGSVGHYIAMFTDISALKQQQYCLERLAHYDPLTHLPNRVLLADRFSVALSQTRRDGDLLAVCYLDLDGFKPVNDRLGHEAGDRLLVDVADRLRRTIRGGDTVARLGGDEFVLLLTSLPDIHQCSESLSRVLLVLAEPYAVDGCAISITASIGVTTYPNDRTAHLDALLRHADQAMYVAKQNGRNCFHLFDPEHALRVKSRRDAQAQILQAFSLNQFRLYYQPKVSMREGIVIGAEALLRWHHPERGVLLPADFLPLIEDTDFLLVLGDWVLEETLRQMSVWKGENLRLPVSVNISARHLQQDGFIQNLAELLEKYPHVQPGMLELEVLETAALDDVAMASAVIEGCHSLGVSTSLDDFGTGYSSLTYLRSLPTDVLKIDQSFIRDMLCDKEVMSLIQGVIGLAKTFNRKVIAEGVETAAHGTVLLGLGCELAQGYGIARPMPASDIPDWVANWRPNPAWLGAA